VIYCSLPWRAVLVDVEGKVRVCCLNNKLLGDLTEEDLESLWNNEKFRKLRRYMRFNNFGYGCDPNCPHVRFANENILKDKRSISLCTIGLNQEYRIREFASRFAGFADEWIYVDGDSNDNSVQTAEDCGARVFVRRWNHDFADQRNFSIQQARGNLILWMDLDEYFCEELKRDFWAIVDGFVNNYDSITFCRKNVIDGEVYYNFPDGDLDKKIRLLKKGTFEFVGKVHEYPSGAFTTKELDSKFHIVHDKTSSEVVKRWVYYEEQFKAKYRG